MERTLFKKNHLSVGNEGEFDGTTTYGSQFLGHMPQARAPAPAPPLREQVPFDSTTSYAQDFHAKALPERTRPGAEYTARPNVPLDSSTSYGDTYQAHPLAKRLPYEAEPVRHNHPFSGTTTNQDVYVQHPISPKQAHGPGSYQPSVTPFEGGTTYGDTFHAHKLQPRAPPPPTESRPHTQFEGTTTYQVGSLVDSSI